MSAESLNGNGSVGLAVVVAVGDDVRGDATVTWAIGRLTDVLAGMGMSVVRPGDALRIEVALAQSPVVERLRWDGVPTSSHPPRSGSCAR